VLRLVNFAYGQLVMAGAFALALAYEWGWPVWAGILLCFAVVIALSALIDRLVFRPLRTQSPAVMLVATFAVAFLLQNRLLGRKIAEVRELMRQGDCGCRACRPRPPWPTRSTRCRRRASG